MPQTIPSSTSSCFLLDRCSLADRESRLQNELPIHRRLWVSLMCPFCASRFATCYWVEIMANLPRVFQAPTEKSYELILDMKPEAKLPPLQHICCAAPQGLRKGEFQTPWPQWQSDATASRHPNEFSLGMQGPLQHAKAQETQKLSTF